MTEKQRAENGRRKLLQSLVATGTIITSANLVPDQWKKPIVNYAAMPVHARMTDKIGTE